MPPKTVPTKVGGLLAKLGAKLVNAHEKHKNDETVTPGGGELPAGIQNGIAMLVDCKFDVYKIGDLIGKDFFYAAAIVQEPLEFTDDKGNHYKLEGQRTSITEPLCDTPSRTRKTLDEHVAQVYNHLALIGVDRASLNPSTLEATAAALTATKNTLNPIYIAFRTFKGPKATTGQYAGQEPRTNQVWMGAVAYQAPNNPSAGVAVSLPLESAPQDEAPADDVPSDIDPNELDQSDVTSLYERAMADDQAAQERLIELAVAAGNDEDTVKSAESWELVVGMIRGEAAAPEPLPPTDPKKGDVIKYSPADPKDKTDKRRLKSVQCEIMAVDPKTKSATLKSLGDGKTLYKSVKWDLLEPS